MWESFENALLVNRLKADDPGGGVLSLRRFATYFSSRLASGIAPAA
jgi:hypothetical protein